MKAIYMQKGESLNYKNDTAAMIEAGDVVVFENRIGIAGTNIRPEELGSLHMVGVFRVPKKAGEEIKAGADLYYSADGMTTTAGADGAGVVGYAVSDSMADEEHVAIKLMG